MVYILMLKWEKKTQNLPEHKPLEDQKNLKILHVVALRKAKPSKNEKL